MTTEEFKTQAREKAQKMGEMVQPLIEMVQPLISKKGAENLMSIYYMDLLEAYKSGLDAMAEKSIEVINSI